MKKLLVINIVLYLFVVSCKGNKENKSINNSKQFTNQLVEQPIDTNNLQLTEKSTLFLDTLSLKKFWNNFKQDIYKNNKSKVIKILDFPIRAIYPVLFQFAYDCDTVAFTEKENKYLDITINQNNINQYYDFIFCDMLKDFIKQTTIQDLLQQGIMYDDKTGLTYRFFPRKYIKTKCSSDYVLTFNIYKINNDWRIKIGGL